MNLNEIAKASYETAMKPLLKCTSDQITEFCENQGVL